MNSKLRTRKFGGDKEEENSIELETQKLISELGNYEC